MKKNTIAKNQNTNKGITLLLVVVLISAILAISIGIFALVFGELKISGEIADSFVAFYAADQGIEKTLYKDRIQRVVCSETQGTRCYEEGPTIVASGACFTLRVDKTTFTEIVTSGQYRCDEGNISRVVKRGFSVTY